MHHIPNHQIIPVLFSKYKVKFSVLSLFSVGATFHNSSFLIFSLNMKMEGEDY